MTTNPSMLRRIYDIAALFALLNVVALGGVMACLIGTGAVTGEQLARISAVLRGDELEPKSVETPAGGEERPAQRKKPPGAIRGRDAVAEVQMDLEIWQRESERIKTELDQRLALNNSILLRVTTEREKLQQELEEAARTRDAAQKRRGEEGFRKQVAIYESLAPKVAVEHLLAVSDLDEAARILLEIDTRKARRIVEAAKRGDQLQKMKVLLQMVRDVAPERSAELEQKEG